MAESKFAPRFVRIVGPTLYRYSGDDLFSQGVAPQVSSAQIAFTTVFGMGTGGTPSLRPPEIGVSSTSGKSEIVCLEVREPGRSGAPLNQRALPLGLPWPPRTLPTVLSVNCACLSYFSYGISLFWNDLFASCLHAASPLLRIALVRTPWRKEEMRVG